MQEERDFGHVWKAPGHVAVGLDWTTVVITLYALAEPRSKTNQTKT
jgi:hypothetical protein